MSELSKEDEIHNNNIFLNIKRYQRLYNIIKREREYKFRH